MLMFRYFWKKILCQQTPALYNCIPRRAGKCWKNELLPALVLAVDAAATLEIRVGFAISNPGVVVREGDITPRRGQSELMMSTAFCMIRLLLVAHINQAAASARGQDARCCARLTSAVGLVLAVVARPTLHRKTLVE
ncbi:unnamed protein product [Amoebophrya sp. A120]|nr:unnamed protein product [Amoebophrya sp. A120]|eukprot:GSA120T00022376001.1